MNVCKAIAILGFLLVSAIIGPVTMAAPNSERSGLDQAWLAYCEEDLDGAQRLVEQVMRNTEGIDFDALYLKAQIATDRLKKFYHDDGLWGNNLNTQQSQQRDRLAGALKAAYESAYQLAPDRYTQACLCAEWWPSYAYYRLKISSQLLLQSTPAQLQEDVSPELQKKVQDQTKQFRSVFRGLLDITSVGERLDDQGRDQFADALSKQFTLFAVIDLPEERFEHLLRWLPVYVNDYMTRPEAVRDPDIYFLTLRWDLWRAMTAFHRHAYESETVHQQFEGFLGAIKKATNEVVAHEYLQPQGEEYAGRARQIFERLGGNYFAPYFRKRLLEYEVKKSVKLIEKDNMSIAKNWQDDLVGFAKEKEPPTKGHIAKSAKSYRDILYSFHWQSYAHYQHPVWHGMLPGELIVKSGANMNHNQVLTFTVQQVLPHQ